jgi:nitrate reductase delta subunit
MESLEAGAASLDPGSMRDELTRFCEAIKELDLSGWEELHTRTLDLSPLFVPYVGHVTWGENYRRGVFMADMQRAQWDAGIDQGGELPDHLQPILRYLAVATDPPDDLVEILPAALAAMRTTLKKADRGNPYRHLLAAIEGAVTAALPEGAQA